MPTPTITQGRRFHYFSRITVSNAAFQTYADVDFNFRGIPSFSLMNDGTGTIEYSFNGLIVDGDLVPGTPSASLVFNERPCQHIWFRLKSGAASQIRVEATAEGTISGGGGAGGSSSSSSSSFTTVATSGASGSFQNVVPMGQYVPSGYNLNANDFAPLQLDSFGNLKVDEQYAPVYEDNGIGVAFVSQRAVATGIGAWSLNTGLGASAIGATGVVVKSSGGRVRQILATNAGATGIYAAILNQTTAPLTGNVIHTRHWIPANSSVIVDLGENGMYLSSGIVIGASETPGTVTALRPTGTSSLYATTAFL